MFRCGIDFLERSDDALKREFLEEIHANIFINKFLGVSENIFTFNGKDIDDVKNGKFILYPEEVIPYL